MSGIPSATPEVPADDFSVRWTGKLVPTKTGSHVLAVASDDGSRLYLDGKMVIDNWGDHGWIEFVSADLGCRYRGVDC